MSVLVCAGKITYPIKYSSDKLGISGVSYVERLTDYLNYNKHIEKIIFVETIDNIFNEEDVEGFDGTVLVITEEADKYKRLEVTEENEGVEETYSGEPLVSDESNQPVSIRLTEETLQKIVGIKGLESIRISDIQWEIMQS